MAQTGWKTLHYSQKKINSDYGHFEIKGFVITDSIKCATLNGKSNYSVEITDLLNMLPLVPCGSENTFEHFNFQQILSWNFILNVDFVSLGSVEMHFYCLGATSLKISGVGSCCCCCSNNTLRHLGICRFRCCTLAWPQFIGVQREAPHPLVLTCRPMIYHCGVGPPATPATKVEKKHWALIHVMQQYSLFPQTMAYIQLKPRSESVGWDNIIYK